MKFIVLKIGVLKKIIVLVLLIAIASCKFDSGSIAGVYFGQGIRKIPIYNVETQEKKVGLSFDAAWGADKTEGIMQILKDYNCNATFFLVGFWAEKYPEIVKKISDNGFEIGTHSNTHPDMCKLGKDAMKLELETSINIIRDIVDVPINLFRPPFGSYNNNLIEVAENLNLKTIQWDVDSLDWKGISGKEIYDRIMKRVKNGSIILCHNNSDHVLDALPLVLTGLKNANFKVTNISDVIYKDNYTINHAGVQILNKS